MSTASIATTRSPHRSGCRAFKAQAAVGELQHVAAGLLNGSLNDGLLFQQRVRGILQHVAIASAIL